MKGSAVVERRSERELVVTRLVDGPVHLVFEAWATPELFKRWWVPRSFGVALQSFEADMRAGGRYRLVFAHGESTKEFFGTYLEVTPPSRLVWTNDEGGEGQTITTVTFTAKGEQTVVTVHDLYPSAQALDEAIASGATSGMPETLAQLDELIASLRAQRSA
ncbi:MAG: SRPBCC family protein [Myxococcota bacterium]